MTDTTEIRKCDICGEEWVDTGDDTCPYCGSMSTEILTDEEEE